MQYVNFFIGVGHEAECDKEKRNSLRKDSSSPIKVLRDAELLGVGRRRPHYVTENYAYT